MTAAVIDACVLYQAALRDLLMHLTVRFVFQPKWTERIHAEWIESVLEQRPDITRAKLERTRDLMNRWARDWEVPAMRPRIEDLALPDPDDRHVLSAAIAADASIIVTFNLSDFPASALAPYGIQAQHPDRFLCDLMEDALDAVVAGVQAHRAALQQPPKSVDDYLASLRACGLPETAARLLAQRDRI